MERRKNACARAARRRGATRVNVAQCRARENRGENIDENSVTRGERRRLPSLLRVVFVPRARVCACTCAGARVTCACVCTCVRICVLRGGSAVRERNLLPEPRYLEESPFLLVAVVIILSSFRRFARVANICVSRCDRSGGRARTKYIWGMVYSRSSSRISRTDANIPGKT